jgi:short-subunit dehydrogenase
MSPSTRPLALVTGASGGIGLELAVQLAGRDHDLIVCAIDDLSTAAEGLRRGGSEVTTVQADLATDAGVDQLVRTVETAGRPLDVLCLNAGVGNAGPFIETPLEDDLRLIALNVTSTVATAKRLLPAMVERGSGRVLITASIASTMPGPWYATYAASKAFLLSFAEAVRYEVKDRGVTVTALMPGPTDTDFFDRSGMQDTVAMSLPKDDPADVARDGIEALFAGKDRYVAHAWRNKVQAAMARFMPEPAQAMTHAQMTKEKA